MSTLITVVAQLPTHVDWLEKHYPECELAWFKKPSEFLELFPKMESSGKLQVIITEKKLPILTKALIIGPNQLGLGYSTDELQILIDNALAVNEPLPAVAFG